MLSQAKYGQVTTGDPDDEWIKKMLQFEREHGSSDYGPLTNFGFNNWQKLGHEHPPTSIDEAVQYYKTDFLPKISSYPAGIKERMGDYIFNTGRNPNDLLLLSSGLATLDEVNSDDPTIAAELKKRFDQNKDKITTNLSKPDFVKSLDYSRDQLYKTTGSYVDPNNPNKRIHYTLDNPNPSYTNAWSKRLNDLYGYKTPDSNKYPTYDINTGGFKSTSQQPTATQQTEPISKPVDQPTTKIDTPPPATTINVPVYPTPEIPVTKSPAQNSRFHPEWEEEGIDPERDLPITGPKKTPYKIPTGPVANQQVPIAIQKQSDNVDIWANPTDINGTPQPVPVNPNDNSRKYPIDNQINKGTPTDINEEDIVDPTNYLKRQKRKEDWNNFKNSKVVHAVTHPGETIDKGSDWLGEKIYQGADWLNNNKQFQKVANRANKIVTGALTVSPVVQYITDLQNQKRWDKRFTLGNLSDNLYAARPASTTGNRGDWTINEGIFRPNEVGFKSKGQYTNQFNYSAPGTGVVAYGGSINKNPMEKIRIRIVGGTEKMATGGQPMTYSGQLGYGINLGQKRIYTDMPPEKTENLNKTIKPVPRDQANIEAEKGETVFGDIDGDGAMEHMLIGGKKHTEGGTPLNVPEGSFIFSDTKELVIKDKAILEKFNMSASKKGYTPAEIAKKYDTTKYKAVIEDENADSIKKATAQIMVKTFERKLAELALIQEQMKGFPQGIPEVAKKYFPNLQTKQDQEIQPGASENIQFGQQDQMQGGAPQEMEQQMQQQPPMEEQMAPQMEFGGMIPTFDLAGEVNDYTLLTGGPDDPNAEAQTYTPKQKALLNDPDFKRFQDLMKKYDTGKYGTASGKFYINAMSPQDAGDFARLASKFGFSRLAEGAVGTGESPTYNESGYRIIQGATPGYSMTDPKTKKQFGFFGGFTPDLYERKVVEDVYGKDASDKMTDVERRKLYFKELGVDISDLKDSQLANPKTLYGNQKFFKEKFYPAFSKTFAKEGFRPEMGDDLLIGAEHYDSYKIKPKPTDDTVMGYICTGRDKATGKANIQSSSYMNTAARDAAGAVASESEAYKQCPEEPFIPNKPGDPCPDGYYKDANGNCVKIPFDFMTPDKVTMLATALGAPKKYLPWGQKLPFEPGDVVFKDWRAKAAERQSLYNKMADQLNTYSPGTATASNLSFLAGQQAEGLIKDIDDVDAYNVQVANAFSDRERQRKDQNNMLNLAKAEELYKGNVIANQQYDNAKRQYFNNMAKAYGNAWKNRMYLGLLNSVNPMFNIDPWQGQSHFKGGFGADDLGGMLSGTTTSTGSTYKDKVADYLRRGYTIADARKYAAEDDRKGTTASTTTKEKNLQNVRALLSGYGGLGGDFNPDEQTTG